MHPWCDLAPGCATWSRESWTEFFLEAGHDADRTDERRDSEGDARDRDERIQGNRPLPAFRAQIPQPDKYFVGKGQLLLPAYQDVEKGRQLRSRFAQVLHVPH